MFFKPKLFEKMGNDILGLTKDTKLINCDFAFREYADNSLKQKLSQQSYLKSITFVKEFPEEIKSRITKSLKMSGNKEEYAILIEKEAATVYANTEIALMFGFVTIQHLNISKELTQMFLYDYPVCPVRGYRAFLPGRNNIKLFKKIVDLLTYYKYNYIVLEIGGAMEYKKHPEINENWIKFCKEIHSNPGRASKIQNQTYPWLKNSIHCDNGDGGFLSQEECRDLADYCRKRYIEVVPECPTMSHCDYICMAHPEIAERQNDPYADTYCPNHPDTYPLVFDILEEVIDVFKPYNLHIGHDEMYSISICEKCKDKDPVELYVNDIKKIHDFLKEKGIGTWMWGEKLLDAKYPTGEPIGGSASVHNINGGVCHVNALYPCRDKLPKDITFLHWYWSFDFNYDKIYHDRNYNMIFGNLSALGLQHWKMRIDWGAKGGFCSNWGSFADEYMQRNNQYINLIGNSCAFWSTDFDDCTKDYYTKLCMKEAYSLSLLNANKNNIFIEHATDKTITHKSFYDGEFIEDSKFLLGNYEITYSDGTKTYLPVKYGKNIYSSTVKHNAFTEVSYSTLPQEYGDEYYYETHYENPYPEKEIIGFNYIPVPGKEDFKVKIKKIDFGFKKANKDEM